MSCDIALSAAILLASWHPIARPPLLLLAESTAAAPAQNPLAREPLYADIISRAGRLKEQVSAYRIAAPATSAAALPAFESFRTEIAALSALDMQGHFDLAKRGTDGDLKCILKGISLDLPRKLTELDHASTQDARAAALQDMFYLLRDNVEVITSPPAPTV